MLTTTRENPGPATGGGLTELLSDHSRPYLMRGHPVRPHGSEPASRTRRAPLFAMAAGLIVTAVASFFLVVHLSPVSGGTDTDTRPPVAVPVSSGVLIGGPGDVSVQTASYEPGQSSGWHLHTGLHAVMVLSGTLSVSDSDCRSHAYGPGDAFVGGGDVHLARNEANVPLEMAVTYMFPDGVSHTSFHIPSPAPANCDVG